MPIKMVEIRFLRDWDPERGRIKGHVEAFAEHCAAALCGGDEPWAEYAKPKRRRKPKAKPEPEPESAPDEETPTDG